MKIVLSDLEQSLDFSEVTVCEFVVENAEKFFEITSKFISMADGNVEEGVTLLENNQEISFSKHIEILYNFYDLDINNKKIQTLVAKHMLEVSKENDFSLELADINQSLSRFYAKLLTAQEMNVFYEAEPTIENIIKMANFKFDESESLEEKIVDYVDMLNKLKRLKIVILVNLNQFLSEQKLKEVIKQLKYLNLKILLVNSSIKGGLIADKRIILDEDLCEI